MHNIPATIFSTANVDEIFLITLTKETRRGESIKKKSLRKNQFLARNGKISARCVKIDHKIVGNYFCTNLQQQQLEKILYWQIR